MSKSENLVKGSSLKSIIRVVHNRENPFVQLNKAMLWNPKLSLGATGLWARCMSRPDNWKFSIKELMQSCKEKRMALDTLMHELIENKLAAKIETYTQNPNGRMSGKVYHYMFFEYEVSEEELAEETEKFKIFLRDSGYRDLGGRNLGDQHLLIKSTKEIDLTEKERTSLKVSSPQSQEAKASEPDGSMSAKADEVMPNRFSKEVTSEIKELADAMLAMIKESHPDFAVPSNKTAIYRSLDLMMRIDNRKPASILDLLTWALQDDFWRDKVMKPNPAKYLREKFDQLYVKMTHKPKPQPSLHRVDRRTRNMDGTPVETPWLENLF